MPMEIIKFRENIQVKLNGGQKSLNHIWVVVEAVIESGMKRWTTSQKKTEPVSSMIKGTNTRNLVLIFR